MRGRRLHNIKHDYLDQVDSAVKAYILGFFIADGTIEVNQTGRYCIRFVQKESDGAILKLIQSEISPDSKIGVITRGVKVYQRLSITSTELGNALMALGSMPRKTYHEFSLPVIPVEYQRHMIRGFFDGDGTAGVYIGPHGVVRQIKITSYSTKVLDDVGEILNGVGIRFSRKRDGSYYTIAILSYLEWYRYIYPGVTAFPRKQNNCELCTLTSSEIKSLKALDPCNA